MHVAAEFAAPIAVVCADLVLLFEDRASAERYMEPIDVKNGEYLAAYDSQGLRLKIEAQVEVSRLLSLELVGPGSVTLVLEDTQPRVGELESALRRHLTNAGYDTGKIASASLSELLAMVRDSGAETR